MFGLKSKKNIMTILITEEQVLTIAQRRYMAYIEEKIDDVVEKMPLSEICEKNIHQFIRYVKIHVLYGHDEWIWDDIFDVVRYMEDKIKNKYDEKRKFCKRSILSRLFGR